jgi:hypothetical protein
MHTKLVSALCVGGDGYLTGEGGCTGSLFLSIMYFLGGGGEMPKKAAGETARCCSKSMRE